MDKCCAHKKKYCSDDEYKLLINRLNRIEGQIRGIKKMVEDSAYCTDILTQVSAINSAANSALDSFSRELLKSHIKSCVVNDIKNDNLQTVDELLDILQKLMK